MGDEHQTACRHALLLYFVEIHLASLRPSREPLPTGSEDRKERGVMPRLETTERVTPRSVLRHRPLAGNGTPTKEYPISANPPPPIVRRASRLKPPDTSDEATERAESHDVRGSAAPKPEKTRDQRQRSRIYPLLYLGMGEVTSLMDRFPPRRRVPNYALCRLTRVSTICGRQPQRPAPSFRHRATATLVLSLPTAAHRA